MASCELTVSSVRDMDQAKELLDRLRKQEVEINKELERSLEQQTQLDFRMAAFQHMLPTLGQLKSDAGKLKGVIGRASQLAESVSCKVRLLDQAKGRVYACMKRVDDVIDLKSCVDGVQYSMASGDYEKAAAHIHRYLTLDENILLETSADSSKGASTVSSSFALLREAEGRLKCLVREQMSEATGTGDQQQVERFFKIFPLLNLHQEGLEQFSRYLCQQLSSRSEANLRKATQCADERAGVVYADTLTLLYEALASSVETHQPAVETYYGPQWMPYLIKQLQAECDVQCQTIVEQLQSERLLDHKVQTIAVALNSRSATGAIRPEVLELDTLLTELSLCSARTELYFRFLRRREVAAADSWQDSKDQVSDILSGCETGRHLQELISKYILIEDYFMRESLTKAVAMDTCNPDGITSSMADDIFFVLQKCTRRAISSGNVDGVCAMLNNASSLLLTEYKSQLQQRIKSSPATGATGLDLTGVTGMLQGKLAASSRAADYRESEASRSTQLIALNDTEVSIENIQKLAKELQVECSKLGSAASESARRKLESCLADFSSVVVMFKELRQVGVQQVVKDILIPGIWPAIEVFSTFSHVMSEEEFGNFEVNDPFTQQFLSTVQSKLTDIKASLLLPVFELVFSELIADTAALLEQQIFKCDFNQLGGVQLDKDLRAVIGYLSSQTGWPVRDKFARLMQISTLLTLETVNELFDYWGGSMVWRLTPNEIRRALHLRTDFQTEDVDRIKLQ